MSHSSPVSGSRPSPCSRPIPALKSPAARSSNSTEVIVKNFGRLTAFEPLKIAHARPAAVATPRTPPATLAQPVPAAACEIRLQT